MTELNDSFAKLLGRQPTDTERQDLYRVRDALGLRNNDSLWLVLMVLQHYQSQYERVPQAIVKTAKETLAGFKATADATAKASVAAAKADLARAVSRTAEEVAEQVAGRQKAQWIAACVIVVSLCLIGVCGFAHRQGYRAGLHRGYGLGYSEAKDEAAAAAWANTPEGQRAYRLAQTGSLDMLTRCDRPGWYVKQGACYVEVAPDGKIYGWRLP